MKIYFLPTVWSDAELLESDGHFALVDTGGGPWHDELLRRTLADAGADRLDFILLTHFHPDHYGCLEMLVREYDVGTVYFKSYSGVTKTDGNGNDADDAERAAETERCRALRAFCAEHSHVVDVEGLDSVSLGGTVIKLYNSKDTVREVYEDAESELYHKFVCNENQNSLAAFFETCGRTVLLAGDVTDIAFPHPAINMMNTGIARSIGKHIDIYKAPHHGYGVGSPEALAIYSPSYVYVTNNEWTVTGNTSSVDDIKSASPDAEIYFASSGGMVFEIKENGNIEKALM